MKNLITKVLSIGVFAVALCIGLQINTFEVKADAQIGSQQGVVLKSTSLTTDKVIVAPKKETDTDSSSSAKSTKSTSGTVSLSRGITSQSNSKSSAVVSKAFQYLGRPYVWGASGPKAFDCSGFTSYVYSAFGVSLPHKASKSDRSHVVL